MPPSDRPQSARDPRRWKALALLCLRFRPQQRGLPDRRRTRRRGGHEGCRLADRRELARRPDARLPVGVRRSGGLRRNRSVAAIVLLGRPRRQKAGRGASPARSTAWR